MSLSVLVMIEMWNSLNALSENQSIFSVGIFSNIYLWFAIVISTLIHTSIIYVPFLSNIFGTISLNLTEWFFIMIFSLPVIALEEILKSITRRYESRQKLQLKKAK